MTEIEYIPLSALQHLVFCERQFALIHIERLWEENLLTAHGRILHDRADRPETRVENGVRIAGSLQVWSDSLGIWGVCDVVEFHDGNPVPVEYKRGKPKPHRADEVQLCAQALCLEEMFRCTVPRGFLFYGRTRRRKTVELDGELRTLTRRAAERCRELIESGETPPAEYDRKRCAACSLLDLCLPRKTRQPQSPQRYIQAALDQSPDPTALENAENPR